MLTQPSRSVYEKLFGTIPYSEGVLVSQSKMRSLKRDDALLRVMRCHALTEVIIRW